MDYEKILKKNLKENQEIYKKKEEKDTKEALKYIKEEIEKELGRGNTSFMVQVGPTKEIAIKIFNNIGLSFGAYPHWSPVNINKKGLRRLKRMLKKYNVEE